MQSESDLPLFSWTPPPKVVPFPLVRHRPRILARVDNAARYRRDTAERQLLRDVETYREVLQRRCIDPAKIDEEITTYRAALFIGLDRLDWTEERA